MSKVSKMAIITVLAVLAAIFAVSPDRSDAQEAKESKVPAKWWRVSPLSYPETDDLLTHVQLTYGYSKEEGDSSTDNHTADLKFYLRKNRLTNFLMYRLKIRDEKSAYNSVVYTDAQGDIPDDDTTGRIPTGYYVAESDVTTKDYKEQKFVDEVRFAIAGGLYIAPGFVWEMSEKKKIDNRFIYYAGAGYDFEPYPGVVLKFYGAYSYEDLEYSDEYDEYINSFRVPVDMEGGTVRSDGYYLVQQAEWSLTDAVTLNESFNYSGNIDKGSRYRWEFNAGLSYSFNKYLSLNLSYREELDNAPQYITSRPRESELNAGVSVSY